jgi:hypothetical protein
VTQVDVPVQGAVAPVEPVFDEVSRPPHVRTYVPRCKVSPAIRPKIVAWRVARGRDPININGPRILRCGPGVQPQGSHRRNPMRLPALTWAQDWTPSAGVACTPANAATHGASTTALLLEGCSGETSGPQTAHGRADRRLHQPMGFPPDAPAR